MYAPPARGGVQSQRLRQPATRPHHFAVRAASRMLPARPTSSPLSSASLKNSSAKSCGRSERKRRVSARTKRRNCSRTSPLEPRSSTRIFMNLSIVVSGRSGPKMKYLRYFRKLPWLSMASPLVPFASKTCFRDFPWPPIFSFGSKKYRTLTLGIARRARRLRARGAAASQEVLSTSWFSISSKLILSNQAFSCGVRITRCGFTAFTDRPPVLGSHSGPHICRAEGKPAAGEMLFVD